MKLSVLIPCYNERNTILEIIDRVRAVGLNVEILVVDDGSVDGTRELLAQLDNHDCRVFYHDRNRGKGAAIRTALKHAQGDVMVIQDADLEYDPSDLRKLLAPIESGEALVVYGSRRLTKNEYSHMRFYLGGVLLSWLTTILYGSRITDEPTCYKMFRADVLRGLDLKRDGFDFCPEVTAKVLRRGIRILEVPISYTARKISEGKKIRWYDGFEAIWVLLRHRFVS